MKSGRHVLRCTRGSTGWREHSGPHLEPLGHVCGADLVVLVRHVAALQLAGLVDLEDAAAARPLLGLLLGAVPGLFIAVLLLVLRVVVGLRVEVGEVKVPPEDLLRLLQGTAGDEVERRGGERAGRGQVYRQAGVVHVGGNGMDALSVMIVNDLPYTLYE